jgi:SAM-dependent methyltransferase
MSATTTIEGSAPTWGPLWGSRAADWATVEEQQTPTYEEAIRRTGIGAGDRVLDVGCGTGVFLRAAAERGAEVCGVDASAELLRIAETRVPEVELRVGEMEDLPFEDDRFDVVCGFNAFFFAADIVGALREARRVTRPGGQVVVQVWGRPERCDIETMKRIVRQYLPDAPPPSELWMPGVLEELCSKAGMTPGPGFDVRWAYEFADAEALGRAMMAPAGVAQVVGPEREPLVKREIVEGLAHCRTESGAYRLENEFRLVVARA